MIGFVRRSPGTVGALKRGHERDAKFSGPYATGPAVLPNGQPNTDMALVYGWFPGKERPREILRWRGLALLHGKDVGLWCKLSDGAFGSVIFGSWAATWRRLWWRTSQHLACVAEKRAQRLKTECPSVRLKRKWHKEAE